MNENENLELWKSFLDFLSNEYKKPSLIKILV